MKIMMKIESNIYFPIPKIFIQFMLKGDVLIRSTNVTTVT